MIEVDLDFIIKGIESQGVSCIVKPRNAYLKLHKNDYSHFGKAITFLHNNRTKEEFTLFVSYKESNLFHTLRRDWNDWDLPQVFWFIEPGNILTILEKGMYIKRTLNQGFFLFNKYILI